MRHTYFDDGAIWEADGLYYDEKGMTYPLTGRCDAVHTDKAWSLDGFMGVAFDQPVRFTNAYRLQETGSPETIRWESHNPALGKLEGTFEVIGNKIISFYTSENGIYSGTETLIQLDEDTYENVGVSFQNGQRMSAWAVTLKRAK